MARQRLNLRPTTPSIDVETLARDLVAAMARSRAVKFLKSRDAVHQAVVAALEDELRREAEREENVRKRIASMKKPPARNSAAWEQLFRSLMEEEYLRDSES